nr:immunoglobulin heavy chain junction region [Mus musculus]
SITVQEERDYDETTL